MTLQATFCATLVDEWIRAGITDAVVAPGSRSTPLALAAAASLRVHVHIDERSAGFFALGLGLSSGRPAPVIVTSGTATAELVPAVVEAHHSRVPMIVCTADRPPELHHVGAPQTIDQSRLYEGLLRWGFDPGAVADLPSGSWRSIAARSVVAARGGPLGPGPVQLNLGFRDPLVGDPSVLPPGRVDGRPWHAVGDATLAGPESSSAQVTSLISGRTGVIVAGFGISDPAPVLALAHALGWPILAAPGSRCRGPSAGAVVVSAFDGILRSPAAAARLLPTVALHLGGPPASKALAAWLAEVDEHVVADPHGAWIDPNRTASVVVSATPADLCHALLAGQPTPAPDGWAGMWHAAEARAQQTVDAELSRLLGGITITEPGIARAVTGALPASAVLVAASSMPIRDVEWYGDPAMICRVVANRGANGIDGLVSTALGVAAGRAGVGPTVALLGDLAFLHDSGGLLGAAGRGLDCVFVVVDNNGGGIFSFLPQAGVLEPALFEQLFGTPHGVDLASLAAVHHIPTVSVTSSSAGVASAVLEAVAAGGVRLVLVKTDRAANVAFHGALVDAVVAGVEALGR